MHPRRLFTLPAIAALLVILADRLLWQAPLGLGAALLALAAGACLVVRGTPRLGAWSAVAGAVVLLLIDPGLIAGILAVILLGAAALLARGWRPDAPAAATRAIIAAVCAALPRLPRDARHCCRHRGHGPGLRAWFIPLLGAIGFLVLFGLGNPLIGRWWGLFGDWLGEIGLPAPGRIVMWWTVLIAVAALARAHARTRGQTVDSAVREPDPHWTSRCLIAFNLAFALQNACDLVYLWAGAGLPAGMTFAAYAHRGAYPLVAAALLAGGFVLVCVRPGGLAERSPLARRLVVAFLVQTVVLAVSSWWRLDLYVEAYGLSRWRLAALVWMGLVALGLALIGVRIAARRSGRWLVEANAWALAVVLVVAAVADLDGLIARHNVERSLTARVTFDLAYTASLGIAALPALERYAAAEHDPDALVEVARLRRALKDALADWRGWNLRVWMVRSALLHFP